MDHNDKHINSSQGVLVFHQFLTLLGATETTQGRHSSHDDMMLPGFHGIRPLPRASGKGRMVALEELPLRYPLLVSTSGDASTGGVSEFMIFMLPT